MNRSILLRALPPVSIAATLAFTMLAGSCAGSGSDSPSGGPGNFNAISVDVLVLKFGQTKVLTASKPVTLKVTSGPQGGLSLVPIANSNNFKVIANAQGGNYQVTATSASNPALKDTVSIHIEPNQYGQGPTFPYPGDDEHLVTGGVAAAAGRVFLRFSLDDLNGQIQSGLDARSVLPNGQLGPPVSFSDVPFSAATLARYSKGSGAAVDPTGRPFWISLDDSTGTVDWRVSRLDSASGSQVSTTNPLEASMGLSFQHPELAVDTAGRVMTFGFDTATRFVRFDPAVAVPTFEVLTFPQALSFNPGAQFASDFSDPNEYRLVISEGSILARLTLSGSTFIIDPTFVEPAGLGSIRDVAVGTFGTVIVLNSASEIISLNEKGIEVERHPGIEAGGCSPTCCAIAASGDSDIFMFDDVSYTPSGGSANSASLSADVQAGFLSMLRPNLFPPFDDIPVGTVERVSIADNGGEGNGSSFDASPSDDVSRVAFTSDATNLVPLDTNGFTDVFVRDRRLGKTILVSRNPLGPAANGASSRARISGDGRAVVFQSTATNLVSGSVSGLQVYRATLTSPGPSISVSQLELVSGVGGFSANQPCSEPVVSRDGGRVAYLTAATNLGIPTGGKEQVLLWEAATGQSSLISVDNAAGPANEECGHPDISDDGSVVAFDSAASNLFDPDNNQLSDIFVRRLGSVNSTLRASEDPFGNDADGESSSPSLDPGSQANDLSTIYVAYESLATNLTSLAVVPGKKHVYCYGHDINSANEVLLVSTSFSIVNGNVSCDYFPQGSANDDCLAPALASFTEFGHCSFNSNDFMPTCAFVSQASNLSSLANQGVQKLPDVFLRAPRLGGGGFGGTFGDEIVTPVSRQGLCSEPSAACDSPAITPAGNWVTFHSTAALVQSDTNGLADVYIRRVH